MGKERGPWTSPARKRDVSGSDTEFQSKDEVMADRHGRLVLVGLAALLGLGSLGCQSAPLLQGPDLGMAAASEGSSRPSLVEMLRPRRLFEPSGDVQPAAASIQAPGDSHPAS